MTSEEKYMHEVLLLAEKGVGRTTPNPMVGCLVVKDGEVIGKGYHEKYGGYHAERNAILSCREEAAGAELYVNLEPCCHHGKTPPCTDIIIEKDIKRVYVGCTDPNPKVSGKGVKILGEHGIEVITGILEEKCREANEVFFHYTTTNLPFMIMKYAMSLDGKTACESGNSKWITGEVARNHVHELRNRYSGIMAGIGTVTLDNPMLNCRLTGGTNPTRIICDSKLGISLECNIMKTAKEIPTIIAFCNATKQKEKQEKIKAMGAELLAIPPDKEQPTRLDMAALIKILGKKGIDSILVEGGGTLHSTIFQKGLVQRVYAYVAPKLVGGANAGTPIGGKGVDTMAEAVILCDVRNVVLGEDYCITGRVPSRKQGEETECLPES